MSGSNTVSVVLQQLMFGAPELIVYAIAGILGVVNLNRAPRVAWLAIGASLVLVVSNLMFLAIRVVLLSDPGRFGAASLGQTLQIIGMVDILVDCGGILALVIAIFLDRHPAAPSYAAGGATAFGFNSPPGFPPPPTR